MDTLALVARASDQWAAFLFTASEHEFETLAHTIAIADDQGRFVRPLTPSTQEQKS